MVRAVHDSVLIPGMWHADCWLSMYGCRALELLRKLCTEALQALPTSVQEDTDQLAALPNDEERLRLALTWRLSHKQ